MLEERGVVHAGRQQHHRGRLRDRRRHFAQNAEEILRVALYWPDRVVAEDLRPHTLEYAPVLDHIRDTRWNTKIVLEHIELAAMVTHEIASDDMRVHAERRLDRTHFATVAVGAEDELGRDETATEDLSVVVDVAEEEVQRAHALLESALDALPLLRQDDPRDEIERHDLLGAARVLIHGERDAARLEAEVRGALSARDLVRGKGFEPPRQRGVVRAHDARRREHLVPELGGIVGRER